MTRNDISDFTADFWNGNVELAGKRFLSGHFVVQILNLTPDERHLIAFDSRNLYDALDEIDNGYLYKRTFELTRESLLIIHRTTCKMPVLELLDTDRYESYRLERMFSDKNCAYIQEYLVLKGKQAENCYNGPVSRAAPNNHEAQLLNSGGYDLNDLAKTLRFYANIWSDIATLTVHARRFIDRLTQMRTFDESHLIAEANKLHEYGYSQSDLDDTNRSVFRAMRTAIEYVPIAKHGMKNQFITARRMHFDRLLDFLIADFFEGIHAGHYPKKCGVCERYFLVLNARNQKYCNRKDPNDPRKRPCTAVAADRGRKERESSKSHRIKSVCTTRLNTLRSYVKSGKIDTAFAADAKKLAQDLRNRAMHDDRYTFASYKQDMTQEAIVAAVEQKRKQTM